MSSPTFGGAAPSPDPSAAGTSGTTDGAPDGADDTNPTSKANDVTPQDETAVADEDQLIDALIEDATEEVAESVAFANGAEEIAEDVVADTVAEAMEDIVDAAEELAEAVVAGEMTEEAAEQILEGVIEGELDEVEEVLAEAEAFVEAAEEIAVEAGEEAIEELEIAEALEAAVHDETSGASIDADVLTDEQAERDMAQAETETAETETVQGGETETETAEVLSEDELLSESVPAPLSPYDRPGAWFVVHTQSGYEKKVKQNLEARTQSMNMEERIHEVVIPMEDVVEFKNGKKVVVQKKMFPGYLLVRCELDDDSWYVIRNTPGVTGFVGQGAKPSPLPRRDVESFLQVKPEGEEAPKRKGPRIDFEVGETVQIKEGPFSEFNGQIIEINEEQLKVKVLVNIFGRETPVELEFAQITKL